jgi:flagellin FlaB
MSGKIKVLWGDERGINALETAIILIAFVVVAAVFAFTILSAGTFTTERSKEAVYAGLEEVRGSLELKGGVIALASTTGTTGTIDSLVFTVANVAGGQPVDFTTGSDAVVVIEYRDSSQRTEITNWSTSFLGYNDGDNILEDRELVEVTVPITETTVLSTGLGVNTTFVVEVKPPVGAVLSIQRTIPANIDSVNDLK